MFKIRYKIIDNIELESWELKGTDGYLEFQIVDETYGIYMPENIDVFMVSIYWWFYYFLKAIIILYETNYCLISDIEKANVWIELKKHGEGLYISKVFAEKPEGSSALESKIIPNITYKYWKDKKVIFANFKSEVLNKAKRYLKELKSLNNKEIHKDIQNLELLIEKVENYRN